MKKSEMKTINNELCQSVYNAEQAIQRVRELHNPLQDKWLDDLQWCAICEVEYPCPTIKALDGE